MSPHHSYNIILARVKEATGIKTQVELAQYFGTVQSTISYWAKCDKLPFWCLDVLYEKSKINPLWILSGEGDKYIDSYPGIEKIKECIDNSSLPISFAMHKRSVGPIPLEKKPLISRLQLRENDSNYSIKPNTEIVEMDNSESQYSSVTHHVQANSQITKVPVYSSSFTGLTDGKGNVFQLEKYMQMLSMYIKDSYRFFSFKSNCMEPTILRESIIVIDTEIVDFEHGKIYAFSMPDQELILASVLIHLHDTKKKQPYINLVFENKSFPTNLTFPYEDAKKYSVGKLVALYHFYE